MTYRHIVEWWEAAEGEIFVESRCPRCGEVGGGPLAVAGSVAATLAALDADADGHYCDDCRAYFDEQERRVGARRLTESPP